MFSTQIFQHELFTLRHHAWTSFEAWGEIYNEVFQESQNALKTQKFFSQNPIVAEPEGIYLLMLCIYA